MRNSSLLLLALMLGAHLADALAATSIYRCVGLDGVVKFQDAPCRSDENGRRIELPDAPPAPVVDVPKADLNESSAPPSRAVVQREPASEIPSVSASILCTREDGSRYLSDSGRGEQRAVPLGVLGIPRESLAEAYGGRDGIGVSAPGLREAPVDYSRHGQIGTMLAWVEDPCVEINTTQLCDFLGTRIADAERRLRLAFSDSRDQRRHELETLRTRARHCPR